MRARWRTAVGVVALFLAAGGAAVWLSRRWPRQTEAAAGALSFVAASALVLAAWKALESSEAQGRVIEQQNTLLKTQADALRQQAQVMRDQWEEERQTHLSVWAEVGPNPQGFEIPVLGGGTLTGRLCPISLVILNLGRHAVRLTGVELGWNLPGVIIPRNVCIAKEAQSAQPLTYEVLRLIASTHPINAAAIAGINGRLTIRLHYWSAVGPDVTGPFEFTIRGSAGNGERLELNASVPAPSGARRV